MRASGADMPMATAAYAAPAKSSLYQQFGKRTLDLVLGLTLLLLAVPFIVLLALVITVTSGFSPFYSSVRIGRHGQPFRLWKLRTMVRDADAVLQTWLDRGGEQSIEFRRSFKLQHDPRVTPLGRILRATSLDELPQLVNVVRGEMSLVGPRPVVADELEKHGPYRDVFLSVRPGITGLWQVKGRNSIDYPERSHLELDYVGRISLLEDIRLLASTAQTVLLKRDGV
jgi:lipopolysaccharide/colanic/teichoic acid biosynthesis glycosyltransferase